MRMNFVEKNNLKFDAFFLENLINNYVYLFIEHWSIDSKQITTCKSTTHNVFKQNFFFCYNSIFNIPLPL